MKVIIRRMYLALLGVVGALAISQDASSTDPAHSTQVVAEPPQIVKQETNIKTCDTSIEFFSSPDISELDLDEHEVFAISKKLCSTTIEVAIQEDKPSLIIEPNRVYYGQSAIEVVRLREGELTPEMEHIILEEGYVLGDYHDVGETYASGVGQTGEFKGMSFKESYGIHYQRALTMFPDLNTYSEELRKNIISSVYRGGITGSPKTRSLIVSGCYDLAADEFLDNREYRDAATKGSGVAKRMERLSNALKLEQPHREALCGSTQ